MEMVAERDQLQRWSEGQEAKHGARWKRRYVSANNAQSIDGLPGYAASEALAVGEEKALSSDGRAL
jgi:hypothetical protein